ncbi:MAG: glycine/sarcosine/betaine reductase complex component C subunit beta [Candidatus Rokubacteria bacterium]|nr:glycine/sarcosine/betaine reductase complex component C subunit beta [Candidatus Rokubacteria bacterium]
MTETTLARPVIRGVRFFLAHAPGLVCHGSKPSRDIKREPAVKARIQAALRPFEAARDYPPTQVLLGALHPDALHDLPRPWFGVGKPGERRGPHGEIAPEEELYGLLKIADAFDLVSIERGFVAQARAALSAHPLVTPADLARLGDGVADGEIAARLAGTLPALPLTLRSGRRVGAIVAGHEVDATLSADVLLENLATKVTAAMALRGLLAAEGVEAASIDYVLNSGEEAVGDRYQRGGGNLAKAVAAEAGCARATGVDVKGFCCGPLHALALAGGLVASRVFERVAVVAGCSLAKLGMKYQGHLLHQQPVLEDVLVGAAIIVAADDGRSPRLRLDVLGRHTVSAGSSQKAILEALVVEPLERLGLKFTDVDKYATELQNPELTEPSGSGNVPLLNYRVIASLAALRKEIAPADVDGFVRRHGLPGFSPTQGHIASAIPFLGHALDGLREGPLRRVLLLAKGSLFLGRMTQMADGLSVLLERNDS